MFDIISVGSATEDVFVHIPPKYLGERFVFVPGTKVEINEMNYFTGGGATNTSVAFARMGFKAAALCAIGDDESGKSVLQNLREEGVSTSLAEIKKGKKTSYSVILTGFGRDRVVLCYMKMAASLGKTLDTKKLNSKWLYISSLHGNIPLLKKLASHAKKSKMKIAFNPGQAELALGKGRIQEIFGRLEVLLLNKEEAIKLTGSGDIHRNLKHLLALANNVVITEGAHGSHATNGELIYSVPSFKVTPVDATGAGDAFGSGFVSAIIKGKSMPDALLWGTANANSVILELGTKNVLLSPQKIGAFIKKYGKGSFAKPSKL
ncbi:MAG: carbohydrate kinase family protein [archaeon]|nr:carbohydrate kinase family protein [archaeon]